MRVAVLHNNDYERYPPGSPSYEADADVRNTAIAVAAALVKHGYEAQILTVDDALEPLVRALKEGAFECVFNLVESLGGDASREPDIPTLLESLGIAYTGNAPGVLRLAQAKDETKRVLADQGVLVPAGVVLESAGALVAVDPGALRFPMFVKPARTDASIGIDQASVARDRDALAKKLAALEASGVAGPYLVEEYLPGREVNVAIFPEPVRGELVCTDIDFSAYAPEQAPIVTYDCKWRPGTPDYNACSLPSRGRLPEEEIAAAQAIARAAFLALGGTAYGRVDLRKSAAGAFTVIDVNPNNDIHPDAGLSIAARSIGVEHDELVLRILRAALEVHHGRSSHPAR